MNGNIKLIHGDCLEVMKGIEDKSIDMILCDLPYGTTACKWDILIPFEPLWEQYNRVIKDNGAIVLFGSEPFSSKLRMSNIEMYKYDWVWKKNTSSNFLQANYQPIKKHEIISVFGKYPVSYTKKGLKLNYYPILDESGKVYSERGEQSAKVGLSAWNDRMSKNYKFKRNKNKGTFPISIIEFGGVISKKSHPTQKPVPLLEYLIKTYANENEIVLDNCMGSGSTGVACVNTNRRFIGIELDENYFNIAKQRIENTLLKGGNING